MAWNGRQFPSYTFSQSPPRYNYEQDKQKKTDQQQDVDSLSDQYAVQASDTSPTTTTPFRTDPSWANDRATMLQSFGASQTEDAAELQHVFPAQNEAYSDTSFLPAIPEHQPFQPHIRPPQLSCGTPYYYTSSMIQPAIPTMQPTFPQAVNATCPAVPDFPALQTSTPTSPAAFSSPLQQPATASMKVPALSPNHRKLCSVEACTSQARAFGKCKRHGGSKRCSIPDCNNSVQSRGLCIRHGGGSRCQEIGCGRAAQSNARCKMHGGGRPCMVPGCEKRAHLKRLCRKHGGGVKCKVSGCEKWAQRQGMCMTHLKVTQSVHSV